MLIFSKAMHRPEQLPGHWLDEKEEVDSKPVSSQPILQQGAFSHEFSTGPFISVTHVEHPILHNHHKQENPNVS
jgi:hypothetical protein